MKKEKKDVGGARGVGESGQSKNLDIGELPEDDDELLGLLPPE